MCNMSAIIYILLWKYVALVFDAFVFPGLLVLLIELCVWLVTCDCSIKQRQRIHQGCPSLPSFLFVLSHSLFVLFHSLFVLFHSVCFISFTVCFISFSLFVLSHSLFVYLIHCLCYLIQFVLSHSLFVLSH